MRVPESEDDGAGPAAFVAVSLKMYLDHAQTVSWCRKVARVAARNDAVRSGAVELAVLPSLPSIAAAAAALAGSGAHIGAQNVFWKDRGPYTGETSPLTLKQMGCRYVEVGHAERKRLFGESLDAIGRKVSAIARHSMIPLVCLGETSERGGDAAAECLAQLDASLAPAVSQGLLTDVVIAYEPEWAIGQAQAASLGHVREVSQRLRERLATYPSLRRARVIYGGSAGPGIVAGLAGAVDGLFLGRFAHDPGALETVLAEAKEAYCPLGGDVR